MGTRKINVNVS